MLRRIRAAAWGLLIAGVLLVAMFVALGALRAKGAPETSQWGLWVAVATLLVGAIGAVGPFLDKVASNSRPKGANAETEETVLEEDLAAVVLQQAQVARSQLIGAGEVGDQAANVRFVKGTGRFREVGGASQGDLATVLAYYQSLSPRRLVVLGEPGSGKTVLAMELLIGLLEERKKNKNIPVPVLVSAAAYDTSLTWENWFARYLAQRFSMSVRLAAGLVRDRHVLPIVDGLDEMDPTGKPERAQAAVVALNSFMQGRERAAVIVTCRRNAYQAFRTGVDRATHIELVPLDGHEAADYLADQLRGPEEQQSWEPVLVDLRANPVGPLAAQLATPWRLMLALTVFRDGGNPTELLPGPRLDGYTDRINKLLLGRYVPAAVQLYDPGGRYEAQQVLEWLTHLANDLRWQGYNNGSATDIQLDIWWRPVGQRITAVAHAALVATIGVPWLVTAAIDHSAYGTSVGLLVLVFAISLAGISPAPPLRIYPQQLTTRYGARRLGLSLVIGLGLGLLLGRLPGLGMAFSLVTGLVSGLLVGLLIGSMDEQSPQLTEPRQVIRASGQAGLALGTVLGIMLGLLSSLTLKTPLGIEIIAVGTVGLVSGLSVWGDKWARYHVAVVIAAIRRSGPIGFGAWLDWAYRAGLLRMSGIAYQFRHRQLQDWLLPDSDSPVEREASD